MTTTTTLQPHVLAIDDDAAMRELIAGYLGENDLRKPLQSRGIAECFGRVLCSFDRCSVMQS